MAASKFYDLARMTVSGTPGTGTITLGSAVPPFLTFAQAGVQDGDVVSYSIIDGTSNSEIGFGTYTASGTSLTRTPTKSTNSNAAISASSSSVVMITARAEDFGVWSSWTPTVTSSSGTITTVGAVTAHFWQIGKSVAFAVDIRITTNGTGAGAVQFTLPVTAVTSPLGAFGGNESGVSGKALTVLINTSTVARMLFYDGTYPGANSARLLCSGTYEAA